MVNKRVDPRSKGVIFTHTPAELEKIQRQKDLKRFLELYDKGLIVTREEIQFMIKQEVLNILGDIINPWKK